MDIIKDSNPGLGGAFWSFCPRLNRSRKILNGSGEGKI